MPTGHPIPNMMDNEVVRMFYTCLKNFKPDGIDFEEVAKILGLRSATQAKERYNRVLRAQERGLPQVVEKLVKVGVGVTKDEGRKRKFKQLGEAEDVGSEETEGYVESKVKKQG